MHAQFFLLWLGMLTFAFFTSGTSGIDDDVLAFCVVASVIHWSVVGLVAVTEDPFLSRRIRRNLPHSKLRRLLLAPFLHGGGRGYLFVLFHLAVLAGIATFCAFAFGLDLWVMSLILGSCCYTVIGLGLACALGRWTRGLSADIRPAHARVLTLILLAIACIGPFIPLLWGYRFDHQYSLLMIANPFVTIDHLCDGGYYREMIWPILFIAAAIAVLVNLRDMITGIREVVFAEVRPRTAEPTAVSELPPAG